LRDGSSCGLGSFCDGFIRQLRPEHDVPEPAGDAEAVFVVGVVVLEVVFLEAAVVGREAGKEESQSQLPCI